jgi:hypothetical protein
MKLYIVYESGCCDDERSTKMIAAADPEQARSIWLDRMCLVEADCVELDVDEAAWGWPGVPEPTLPAEPGEWWPSGKTADGLELWRGYGLWADDDEHCEGCDQHLPSAHMHDEYLCRACHQAPVREEGR